MKIVFIGFCAYVFIDNMHKLCIGFGRQRDIASYLFKWGDVEKVILYNGQTAVIPVYSDGRFDILFKCLLLKMPVYFGQKQIQYYFSILMEISIYKCNLKIYLGCF